jgi:thioredoxin
MLIRDFILQLRLKFQSFMRRILFGAVPAIFILGVSCTGGDRQPVSGNKNQGRVIHMTEAVFKQEVFNYDVHKEWKLAGRKPVIIDFYADWCRPCLAMSPLLEEVADEYRGKLVVYKVDADKEKPLAKKLGIRSLPTLMFIPVRGTPQLIGGGMPKDSIVKAVHEILLVN